MDKERGSKGLNSLSKDTGLESRSVWAGALFHYIPMSGCRNRLKMETKAGENFVSTHQKVN